MIGIQHILDCHNEVGRLASDLDAAKERRAIVFALANEQGVTSGALARLTRTPPASVQGAIRAGRGLLVVQRRRSAA